MKIDNSDKSQQIGPKPAEKTGPRIGQSEFAQVLQKTVQTERSSGVTSTSMSTPLRQVDFSARPETAVMAARQTGEILDTLETYQQMLANPSTNLRNIQPVLAQLEQEANCVSTSMNQLPQGHELREIMHETLIQVNQEIERFNQGVYI
jgi:hypothetical protein